MYQRAGWQGFKPSLTTLRSMFYMFDFLFNPPLAHVILRVVLGILFIIHGYPKLFKNFSGFAGWLGSMGFWPAKFWALVAGVVEFFGGMLLALGIGVQIIGILIAIQMLVVMVKVKWGKVGLTATGGWELELMYLVVALALAMMGTGIYTF